MPPGATLPVMTSIMSLLHFMMTSLFLIVNYCLRSIINLRQKTNLLRQEKSLFQKKSMQTCQF